ncbi:hypothetical protein AB0M22_28260 [Nocardia sp. NPDC051756]|uniref:hypothetical protein n=1 Tax=Nocardia sp. NPDC051756 TaxID=3154751 RepID=UPI0034205B67
MTIYANSRSMTSSATVEWAWRAGRTEPAWRLSWLPNRLTREQARAGMELAELLGRSNPVSDNQEQARADALAGALGLTVQAALSVLHQRMHDRHPRD